MPALTNAEFNAFTDKINSYAVFLINSCGDSTLTSGTDYGANRMARDLMAISLAWQDQDRLALETSILALQNTTPYQVMVRALLYTLLTQFNRDCASVGNSITNINAYAAYYNTGLGGSNLCLLAPDWRKTYSAVFNTYPNSQNVYAPPATLATIDYGGSITVVSSVDTTKYAGAATATLTTSSLAGTDLVTCTGTNQHAVSARTWTATPTTDSTITLTPTVSGDMIVSVSGITLGGGITAGHFVVAVAPPSGRSYPTT